MADAQEAPPYRVPHTREPYRIVHADRDLLLVHKPDLLLSVPGRHPVNRDSLLTRLQAQYPEVLLVHRLDLDTSGIMVFARRREVQSALGRLFQERRVEKHYVAVVDGVPAQREGCIDLPIARDWLNRPRQKICAATGKEARTRYRVLDGDARSSRLLLTPETGRSHQLRIHCRELGHPILGCDLYAPSEVLGRAPRLMLHASRIAFTHPGSGRELVGHSAAPF